MKNFKKFIPYIFILLFVASTAKAVTIYTVPQGGTGVGTITGIVQGNGTSPFSTVTIGSGLSYSGGTLSALGTSPGGSNTQVQFNNSGVFGGISGATTNGTAITFASGALIANDVKASTSAGITFKSNAGTDVALFGAGGGAGVTFYDGIIQQGAYTNTSNSSASSPSGKFTGTWATGTSITATPHFLIEPTQFTSSSVTGVASTDILTIVGHTLTNFQPVYFSSITGGSGLSTNTVYYVGAVSGNTFQLATTISNAVGGTFINFTTDITAGTLNAAGVWNTSGTGIGVNSLLNSFAGNLIDLKTAGQSRLSYTSGAGIASNLSLFADSNTSSTNQISFLNSGNGTDFIIGTTRTTSYPAAASNNSIIGVNGGGGIRITPYNNSALYNTGDFAIGDAKFFKTFGNGVKYLNAAERASNTQAQLSIGTTALAPANTAFALGINMGVTPVAADTTGFSFLIQNTLTASANNQTLTAMRIKPTFTNGAFTGLTNTMLDIQDSAGTNLFNLNSAGTIALKGGAIITGNPVFQGTNNGGVDSVVLNNSGSGAGTAEALVLRTGGSDRVQLQGLVGGDLVVTTNGSTEAFRSTSGQNFGIGTGGTVSAKLHVISTTEQQRLGYDASNYFKTTVASNGSTTFALTGTTPTFTFSQDVTTPNITASGNVVMNGAASVLKLKSYTVGTLPAGVQGDMAYVTDALAPAYNAPVVGGGAVKIPVFYNGAAWTAH